MRFADEDYEYVPCVCCGMGNQLDNGFCYQCNDLGCPNDPYFGGPDNKED